MAERVQRRIDRALIIALPVLGADPLDRIARLPLVLRTALTLQSAGFSEAFVAIAPGDRRIEACLTDPRLRLRFDFVEADDPRAVLAEASVEAPLVVAAHDVVASSVAYRALAEYSALGSVALARRFASELPVRLGPEELELARARATDLDGLVRALCADGRIAEISVPGAWTTTVRDAAGRRRALRLLFEDCRKPVDGIVSRLLNRNVSLFISRQLVELPVTPNQMTIVAIAVGIAGSALASGGGYGALVGGALLVQTSSILDGVDGELARVRFEHTRLGQWLDTVGDDVVNVSFYAAVAWATLHAPPPGPTLAAIGFAAVAAGLVTMLFYYSELVRIGSGDFYALGVGRLTERRSGLIGALVSFGSYVTKRDFFIFAFLIAAIIGILPYLLPAVLAGTVTTALAGARLALRRFSRG